MEDYAIFTDGSTSPNKKAGAGAFLLLPYSTVTSGTGNLDKKDLASKVRLNRFNQTSSSRLEVETVIWTLQAIKTIFTNLDNIKFTLFTDSQTVTSLLKRRQRLEKNNFIAKSSGKELKNSDLYKIFYELYDELNIEIQKVQGHTRSKNLSTVQFIFGVVDQQVRKALKNRLNNSESNL